MPKDKLTYFAQGIGRITGICLKKGEKPELQKHYHLLVELIESREKKKVRVSEKKNEFPNREK